MKPAAAFDKASLRAEAKYFHRAIFRTDVPDIVIERYVRLHDACFRFVDETEKDAVSVIVQEGLDVEAIEYAYRLQRRSHLLSRKLHSLLYLIEVRREYYSVFFSERNVPFSGKGKIAAAILRSLYKVIWGKWLIWRYGLD